MTSGLRGASPASLTARFVRRANSIIPLAARAAIQELRPDLDEYAAGMQASAAIHYTSVFHTKWLWHRFGDSRRKL